jgi:hypothetical protein
VVAVIFIIRPLTNDWISLVGRPRIRAEQLSQSKLGNGPTSNNATIKYLLDSLTGKTLAQTIPTKSISTNSKTALVREEKFPISTTSQSNSITKKTGIVPIANLTSKSNAKAVKLAAKLSAESIPHSISRPVYEDVPSVNAQSIRNSTVRNGSEITAEVTKWTKQTTDENVANVQTRSNVIQPVKTKKPLTVWEPPKNPDAKINLANESSFAYILNNELRCLGDFAKNPSLFIYVESAASDFHRRRVWRSKLPFFQTYGNKKVTFMFILALPKDKLTQAKVVNESKTYGDILQLNYTDDYRALVLKTVAGMRWVMKYCGHAQYVMKTDGDVFISVHAIFNYLEDLDDDRKDFFYGGYIQRWAGAMREGKWGVTEEEYPYDLYPPYVLGFGIFMGKKTVARLYERIPYIKYYVFEDVYVGMLAKASNVNITWVDGFKPYYGRVIHKKIDYCEARRLKVIHDFRSGQLLEFFWNIFEEFAGFGFECSAGGLI